MNEEIFKKDIIQKEIILIKYDVKKNFNPMLNRVTKLLLQVGYRKLSVRVHEIEKSLGVEWCITDNKNVRCIVFENDNHKIVITKKMIIIYTNAPQKHLVNTDAALKFITHRILEAEATTIQEIRFEAKTLDYIFEISEVEKRYNYLTINETKEEGNKKSRTKNGYSDNEQIEYENSILAIDKFIRYEMSKNDYMKLGAIKSDISVTSIQEINDTVLNDEIILKINELKSKYLEVLKSLIKDEYLEEIIT